MLSDLMICLPLFSQSHHYVPDPGGSALPCTTVQYLYCARERTTEPITLPNCYRNAEFAKTPYPYNLEDKENQRNAIQNTVTRNANSSAECYAQTVPKRPMPANPIDPPHSYQSPTTQAQETVLFGLSLPFFNPPHLAIPAAPQPS